MRLDPRGVFYAAIAIVLLITVMTQVVLPAIYNVNTSGWGLAEIALWGLAGIVAVGGIIVTLYALFF